MIGQKLGIFLKIKGITISFWNFLTFWTFASCWGSTDLGILCDQMAGAFPIGIPKEKAVILQICCKFLTLSKRIDIIDQYWIGKCFWQMAGTIVWRVPHEKRAFLISCLIPAMYNGLSLGFCDNLWIFHAFCLKSVPRLIYLKKRKKILSKTEHFFLKSSKNRIGQISF